MRHAQRLRQQGIGLKRQGIRVMCVRRDMPARFKHAPRVRCQAPPRLIKRAARLAGNKAAAALQRVVHLEFQRMGAGAVARDILHFQINIGVDEVIAKDATGFQEVTILI